MRPSYRYLDICVHAIDSAENCSTCWKCARTLLTLEILGQRSLYDQAFDLSKFDAIKPHYIQTLLRSEKPLEKEVVELAKIYNYDLLRFSGCLSTHIVGANGRAPLQMYRTRLRIAIGKQEVP